MAPLTIRADHRQRRRMLLRPLLIIGVFAAISIPAFATSAGFKIQAMECVPIGNCVSNTHAVSTGGRLRVNGEGIHPGVVVFFHSRRGRVGARIYKSTLGDVVTVPHRAVSGRVYAYLPHARRRSASFGPIHVYNHALSGPSALDGESVWIYYLEEAEDGNVASIIAQAHAANISTLIIKSGDGATYWAQFSPELVAQLHAAGLRVCAWQYAYGKNPVGEATTAVTAVANGADCLVIDAETEYEGRYAAAQTYLQTLRGRVGPSYELALASFPLTTLHPRFPYSVFLGPGGAQLNMPQMYWKTIGTTAAALYAATYADNAVYARALYPLAQDFGGVSPKELLAFRGLAQAYGAKGVSLWEWTAASSALWQALAATPSTQSAVTTIPPIVETGDSGDIVLWMQEHLATISPGQPLDGEDGAITTTDLETFQSNHGLPASGVADAVTWQALLQVSPVTPSWSTNAPKF